MGFRVSGFGFKGCRGWRQMGFAKAAVDASTDEALQSPGHHSFRSSAKGVQGGSLEGTLNLIPRYDPLNIPSESPYILK